MTVAPKPGWLRAASSTRRREHSHLENRIGLGENGGARSQRPQRGNGQDEQRRNGIGLEREDRMTGLALSGRWHTANDC